MPKETSTSTAKRRLWTGRIVTALCIVFLVMDGVLKVMQVQPSVEGTTQLGYPAGVVLPIGAILLICTLLYAIPGTSVLGAILLTGYLGGAVATQVRVGNPFLSHVMFPVFFGVMIWGGLFLRDSKLRDLIPVKR